MQEAGPADTELSTELMTVQTASCTASAWTNESKLKTKSNESSSII